MRVTKWGVHVFIWPTRARLSWYFLNAVVGCLGNYILSMQPSEILLLACQYACSWQLDKSAYFGALEALALTQLKCWWCHGCLDSSVQFDCGIHPGYSGMAALPYFDEIDPISIDVLLVTQWAHSSPTYLFHFICCFLCLIVTVAWMSLCNE